METKGLLSSKTMWFNALVPLVMFYLNKRGANISPEEFASFLGIGNLVLRTVTKDKLDIGKLF